MSCQGCEEAGAGIEGDEQQQHYTPVRGRQGREVPRTEGRIHRKRDQKKQGQAKTNEKEEGSSSVVCLSERKTSG